MIHGSRLVRNGLLAVLVVVGACFPTAPASSEPELIGEGRRVLFIGNSYLYTQDIAGIVQALADSGGVELAVETVAAPDMALIDHWKDGLATREIAGGGWEWVVLQQGPSSTDVNRDSLRLVTGFFAAEIAKVNGKVALFSAWPSRPRRQDFPRAIESYTLAAADVGGILLPVATAWLETWEREPSAELYADDLHPSIQGAYLTALVIYARLLNVSPVGLPSQFRTHTGRFIQIATDRAAVLQAAAAEAIAQ
jgi:hypothetical protein